MARKESSAPSKRIPTVKEVKEPTNKLLRAVETSEMPSIKSADKVYSSDNEVVTSSSFETEKSPAPTGKAIPFERILPNS